MRLSTSQYDTHKLPYRSDGNAMITSSSVLSTLYLNHAEALRRYACARGASREDAEEVVQEVFIRLNSQERLSGLQNVLGYMRTIVVNLLRDQYRYSARQPDLVDIDELEEPLVTQSSNPAARFDYYEAISHMQSDLLLLSDEARQVFLLHRLQGKSYDAIAEECSMTVAAVRKHLRDTLVLLTQKRIERDN